MPLLKKVCMVGSFAVGKTSLVRRFVQGFFADTYLTTVGVKLDNKTVRAGEKDVKLVLWDLSGDDAFQKIQWTYLRGAAGYLLVADGTRAATLAKAETLEQEMRQEFGAVPFVFLINKSDRLAEWELEPGWQDGLVARGWDVLHTSAKTGEGVEEAFGKLTAKMLL
jgi:small GTP-binding protein